MAACEKTTTTTEEASRFPWRWWILAAAGLAAAVLALFIFSPGQDHDQQHSRQYKNYVLNESETKICLLLIDIARHNNAYPPGHPLSPPFEPLLLYKLLFPWVQTIEDVGLLSASSPGRNEPGSRDGGGGAKNAAAKDGKNAPQHHDDGDDDAAGSGSGRSGGGGGGGKRITPEAATAAREMLTTRLRRRAQRLGWTPGMRLRRPAAASSPSRPGEDGDGDGDKSRYNKGKGNGKDDDDDDDEGPPLGPRERKELELIAREELLGLRIVDVLTDSSLRGLYDENLISGVWGRLCSRL